MCSRTGRCGRLSAWSGVVRRSGIGAVLSHRHCFRSGRSSGSWSEVVVQVGDGLSVFFELLLHFVKADAGVVDAVG